MNNSNQKIKVNIDKNLLRSQYSDYALISQSYFGFHLDFGQRVPGAAEVSLFSRVAVSPQHAKLLLNLLRENVEKYEEKFGEIPVPKKNSTPSGDNPDHLVHFVNEEK
jgi:hypothetical protein